MFIEKWPNLAFDPHGTNVNNDIVEEAQQLTDKTCPWIVPNGAPFVAGSVKIKTSDGQPVKTGWKEVFKPMPLIEMTGLDINTFIELDAELLEQYDNLVISYHSVGIAYIPRASLEAQLDAVIHGADDIPWSKVIQVPDQLPPSEHWHNLDELLGWEDLVYLVRYLVALADQQVKQQVNIDDIYSTTRTLLDGLIARYNLINTKMINHGSNHSNPHQITAFDLLLGNVSNFAMATVADDIAGVRSDLFSTPEGAVQAVKSKTPDTSILMKNGTLPISLLGSSDYLPPVIDGSFEGIGTDNNNPAICLENNGRVMIVKRHYDGRIKGLYYSYIEDYKDATSPLFFTGFRYENSLLKAAGYNLDTVLRGSGQDVLVVGDSTAGKWWVSLTNGTLNPQTHVFTELNLSGLVNIGFDQANSPTTVGSTKNYIIFCCSDPAGTSHGLAFYRLPKSSLGGGAVAPTLMYVNYTDVAGRVKSNQGWYFPDEPVRDANGRITNYLFPFPTGLTGIGYKYCDPTWFVEESTDVLVMRQMLRPFFQDTAQLPSWGWYMDFNVGYRIDVTTGNMTLLDKTTSSPIYTTNPTEPVYDKCNFVAYCAGIDYSGGGAMLPTGDYIFLTSSNSTTTFPMTLMTFIMAQTTAIDALKVHLVNASGTWRSRSVAVKAPTNEGPNAGHPVWDAEGEFIPCWDQSGTAQITVYRKVSGGMAQRAGLTNKLLGNLLGRPLVNTVYRSNLGFNYPSMLFTGTDAELNAAGVECGTMSLSSFQFRKQSGSWTALLPGTPGIATTVDGLFVMPRTHSKTLNDDSMTMTVNPLSYYALSPTVVQQILAMFPAELSQSTYLSMRLMVPYQAAVDTPLARGLPCFVEVVAYSDVDKTAVLTSLLALNLTQSNYATGSVSQPVINLTNPTLVAMGNVYRTSGYQPAGRNMYIPSQGGGNHWPFYKNGTQYTVKLHSGIMTSTPGGAFSPSYDFVWDTASNSFVSQGFRATGYGRDDIAPVIPRVGYGTLYNRTYTGNAVLVANANGNNYLLAGVYPDSGWVVYFKEGTKLVLNGTSYDAPTGMVDLRDIDPSPQNKKFYVYMTCYGDQAYYIVSGRRIRHNLSLVPAAEITTNATQILTIERFTTFMIGDAILSSSRKAGSIPLSIGMPMDEGTFSYVYQSDLQ